METLVKQFGWGGVVASEGLPKCPMGRLEREPLHIKPFREQLFKSVHFGQSFTRYIYLRILINLLYIKVRLSVQEQGQLAAFFLRNIWFQIS